MSPPDAAVPALRSLRDRLGLLALRVLVGTSLFAVVLILVQSGDRRVAGMMLTFPALNGLSLMLTPTREKRAMAAAMLPVIALNGLLAMAFIAIMGWLGNAAVASAPLSAWVVVAGGIVVWLAACLGLSWLSMRTQGWLLAVYLAASVVLVVIWWTPCPETVTLMESAADVLARQAPRIALFAATLGGLLLFAETAGARHGWLGRLGAFPLLPLFSLAIIASSGPVTQMSALRAPILLGLLLAMAFAFVYAASLEWIAGSSLAPRGRSLAALVFILVGWLACAGIVFGTMGAMNRLEGCGVQTGFAVPAWEGGAGGIVFLRQGVVS